VRRCCWLSIASLALVLTGCFRPHYGNGDVACQGTLHPCPPGYACGSDGRCWIPGSEPAPPADMTPPAPGPAPLWTSCGGGSATGSAGSQLNLSVCGSNVGGAGVSPHLVNLTFGVLASDTVER
jgi:hypothetical protein